MNTNTADIYWIDADKDVIFMGRMHYGMMNEVTEQIERRFLLDAEAGEAFFASDSDGRVLGRYKVVTNAKALVRR